MFDAPVNPLVPSSSAEETPSADSVIQARAHAARYCILRRLAPALKHDLVVNLQGVSIIGEILAARLDKGTGGQGEALQPHIDKINRLTRDAIDSCLVVAGWIDTVDDEAMELNEGISESIGLLQNSLGFAGFTLRYDPDNSDFQVCRVLVRNLVCAALIILADTAGAACEIVVSTQLEASHVTVVIARGQRTEMKPVEGFDFSQIRVLWLDVQSLAQVEGVKLWRDEDAISMRLPRMQVKTALKIVPV